MIQAIPFSSNSQSAVKANNLSRILTAAVVSQNFKRRLLSNPVRAVKNGFINEKFDLSKEEMAQLSAIKAENLAEFALHLARS